MGAAHWYTLYLITIHCCFSMKYGETGDIDTFVLKYTKSFKDQKFQGFRYWKNMECLQLISRLQVKNVHLFLSSRGGLELERWSDNRLHFASVGSNLRLSMVYQSLSDRNVLLLIHNIEKHRALGFLIHALDVSWQIMIAKASLFKITALSGEYIDRVRLNHQT